MTLDSEGIETDGDAFGWLDENIPGQFQIQTNSEGYTLSMQFRSARLLGVYEHRAEFAAGPNTYGTVTHERVRGTRGKNYNRKERGETLREALGKHFDNFDPDAYESYDGDEDALFVAAALNPSTFGGDKTDEMNAEEFLQEYEPDHDYERIFLAS